MPAIPVGAIISIGLKLVANRDKIANAWGTVQPILKQLQDSGVIADLVAEGSCAATANDVGTSGCRRVSTSSSDAGLAVDGSYGEKTREAVTAYQQAHSLEPDGWAGVATQASIYEELAKRP